MAHPSGATDSSLVRAWLGRVPFARSPVRARTIAPLILVALWTLACATHTRQMIGFDPRVDFSDANQLAFFENTEAGASQSSGLHRTVTRRAIERELVASGHSFVTPPDASLLVVYHVGTRAKAHTEGMIAGEVGTESALVISFRDPKTQRSVWWGSTELMIDKRTKVQHEIDRLVKSLLDVFPPAPGTKPDYPLE
jgi:hypothetical protein